jgi:molybdopterin-guanine dinucleotide biosynthesis protein A
MGTDKRSVPVEGTPLLLRTLERCDGWPLAVAIDPRDSPSVPLPDPVQLIADSRPGEGPLAALEAGLAAMNASIVVVVAGDMPWVEPAVLRLLASRLEVHPNADIACLADEAGPRPMPLAIRRRVLGRLTRLLDQGERRLRSLLPGALVIPLDAWLPLDPGRGSLRDVDVPADLVAVP